MVEAEKRRSIATHMTGAPVEPALLEPWIVINKRGGTVGRRLRIGRGSGAGTAE
jgi:hypothetical protein